MTKGRAVKKTRESAMLPAKKGSFQGRGVRQSKRKGTIKKSQN